jgi:hypothetical protein
MKRIASAIISSFFLLILITLTSCKTATYTAFKPFDARLEPVPNSIAKYLIFLNSSGRELHDYSFSAYIWNDHGQDQLRRTEPVKRYIGSGVRLMPGESIRFHPVGFGIEDPISQNVSRLEIMGHSREGDFRERWLNTPSSELKLVRPNYPN